jgi:hypothetical protein
MKDFSNTISPSSWNTIKDSTSCNYSKLPEFLKKWQNPCEADSQNDEYDEILKEIRRINDVLAENLSESRHPLRLTPEPSIGFFKKYFPFC